MFSRTAFARKTAAIVTGLALAGACSNNTTVSGPGVGSALCGPNGTNNCGQQICDPTLGCVECETSTNCPAGNPYCIQGSCAVCSTNADCGTGARPACYPNDHTCHPACTNNASCPHDQPICVTTGPETGDCVGCNTAQDCGQGAPICNATTQQCVQCQSDADCHPPSPRCDVLQGQCVQCLANSDCGTAAPICRPNDFTCHGGCTSNADCQGAAPLCNTTISQCVECQVNTDCPASAPFCVDQGVCAQCQTNKDCPAATPTCRGGTCR